MPPARRPWFRFYVEAVHDRKLRRLKPETRWLFVACLAAARQSPIPGQLLIGQDDPMGWDDLTDFAGVTRKQAEDGMDALQGAGIVTFDGETWSIPNWNDRQYESDDVTVRTRKHRSNPTEGTTMERSNDDDGTFQGTPPENREQRTEAEGVARTVRRTHHDLLRPDASPLLQAELDQAVDALVAVHGAGEVDTAIGRLLVQRLCFPFPSKARQAIEGLLPARTAEHPLDAAQQAQRALMTRTHDCSCVNGWVEDDDGITHPCPACRAEDARLEAAS